MNHIWKLLPVLGIVISSLALQSRASAQMLETRIVVDSLSTPWEIAWGIDGWIWMSERGGRISRVDPSSGTLIPLIQIPDVVEVGESGLLGMALSDSSVYVVYTYQPGDRILEKLVRYRYDGAMLVEPTVLLDSIPASGTHSGSRIVITADDKILMTTGDGGLENAQDHMTLNGKILRMNLDGSAPADNPWPNAPHPARLVWSTGHRNAQGLVLATNGRLYASEHGANSDDEINIIVRGGNYGWPMVEGFCDTDAEITFCRDSNVVEPIRAWTPTIAPAGLDYYDNPAIPGWRHSLILATLKQSDVRVLQLSPDGSSIVREIIYHDPLLLRARDLCIAPDGRVFVATLDRLVEITPTPGELEIGTPTIEAAQIRAGEPFRIRFTVRGPAAPGNRYSLSLSGPRRVIRLASTTDTGDVVLDGVFPCTHLGGDGFRLRLDSELPERTVFGAGEPMTFIGSRIAVITPANQGRICLGDTVRLRGVEGAINHWSTGDTAIEILVTNPGRIHLRIIDGNCIDSTWHEVTFTDTAKPEIAWVSTWNAFSVQGFHRSYQWYRDGQEIAGATYRTLTPTIAGRYAVRAIADNMCWGSSAIVEYSPTLVHDDEQVPLPVIHVRVTGDELAMTLDDVRPGAMTIDVLDLRGNVARSRTLVGTGGRDEVTIPIGDLARGVYIMRVRSGSAEWTRKIIVR